MSNDDSWGYASHDMYTRRWELIANHLVLDAFTLVDWGSDAGWFSVQVAKRFPGADVISVEAGIMSDGAGLDMHRRKLAEFEIRNNTIVDCLFGPDTYSSLYSVPSDFQFVLSVFHHLGDGFGRYLRSREDWDRCFCDLVRGARVTFFEVPNEESIGETPHGIRNWYAGRPIEEVLSSALRSGPVSTDLELLGETQHGEKGMRKLFMITRQDHVETTPAEKIAAYIAAAGGNIRIQPYRKLRLTLSRLLRKLRLRPSTIVSENA